MPRQFLNSDNPLPIPEDVSVCPYCGKTLTIQPTGWTRREDGTWACDEFDMNCADEPDIDAPEWEEWDGRHDIDPFSHWMPVKQKIERWMDARFDWEIES